MTTSRFEIAEIIKLLRRPVNDELVLKFFTQREIASIKRHVYYGFLRFKPEGVEVAFREAHTEVPKEPSPDPHLLHVSAFHLHRDGHAGFREYSGQLPNGVAWRDRRDELIRKMGPPVATGGGNLSPVSNTLIPLWLRYKLVGHDLQFQLGTDGQLEMVTLFSRSALPWGEN